MSVRGDFDGGALSSDFGALLLAGVDRQIGLSERLAGFFADMRHESYITHVMRDLLKQRIYQQASGYEDGNDSNDLRIDPMFKLAVGRKPLDEGNDLASQPTFSRLENAATRKDIYRMSRAMVDQFMASYAKAPKLIVLDMDHTSDRTFGQQELAFYNHHYRRSLLKANEAPAESTRLFEEYEYAAASWPQAFRIILKAEVMDAGDNSRFIVTLRGTAMSRASASTIISKIFKIAVRLVQYKDRIKLHLPSSCPAKALLLQVTEILYKTPPPKIT